MNEYEYRIPNIYHFLFVTFWFRSIQQGDEGEYICSHASDPDSNVKFDLVVVQPISFGDTPKTQVKDTLMAVVNIISRLPLSDVMILS